MVAITTNESQWYCWSKIGSRHGFIALCHNLESWYIVWAFCHVTSLVFNLVAPPVAFLKVWRMENSGLTVVLNFRRTFKTYRVLMLPVRGFALRFLIRKKNIEFQCFRLTKHYSYRKKESKIELFHDAVSDGYWARVNWVLTKILVHMRRTVLKSLTSDS